MSTITVRQRILEYIGRRNSASAAQIGQALNLSAATVRHHLSILVADGRIVAEGTLPKAKRGRPQKTYRLSDRVAGENLDVIADIALNLWLEGVPDSGRQAAMQHVADTLRSQLGGGDGRLPAQKRIVQLIENLDRMHYHARWEAGAEGPRILFGHCPYAAIIEKHPELCAMDAELLQGEMGADVEQLAKIERKPGGATQCIFAVRRGHMPAGG